MKSQLDHWYPQAPKNDMTPVNETETDDDGDSSGVGAGVVILIILCCVAVGGGVAFFVWRKKKQNAKYAFASLEVPQSEAIN